jgi:hypothetical protein
LVGHCHCQVVEGLLSVAVLYQIGCDDLELARLAEAHFDATAIAAEAGRDLVRGGVRESESSIALW